MPFRALPITEMEFAAELEAFDSALTPVDVGDAPSGPLFHYTGRAGFEGILSSREIRATHYEHLNDTREMRIGEEAVLEVARALASVVPALERSLLDELIARHSTHRLTLQGDLFVASFSGHGDLLSQWRAYGTGCTGYSIGFSSLPVRGTPGPRRHGGIGLLRCEYDTATFHHDVRKVLNRLTMAYADAHERLGDSPDRRRSVTATFLALLFRHAGAQVIRLKDEAFRDEREWRLVLMVNPERAGEVVNYLETPRGRKPYVPISLVAEGESLPSLSTVFLGPLQPEEDSREANAFLARLGYPAGILKRSRVPLRD